MTQDQHKPGESIRVPWGSWELGDGSRIGRWHHNPALSLSAAEQRAQNEANGYECQGTDGVPADPTNKQRIGIPELIEAAHASRNFVTGTTNWAASMLRFLKGCTAGVEGRKP